MPDLTNSWYPILLVGLGITYILHRLNLIGFRLSVYTVLLLMAVTFSVPWADAIGNPVGGVAISLASVGFIGLLIHTALRRKGNDQKR